MTEYILLATFTFVIGIIAGWIITRMKFKSRIDVLVEKKAESAVTIGNLRARLKP